MTWCEKYLTGIEEIDNQQVELVETIYRFKESLSDDISYTEMEVGQTLKYLVDYAMNHFPKEESYMISIGYPDYDEHKRQHSDFTRKLISILSLLKGKGSYRPIQLYYFLIHWLEEHIAVEDMKLAKSVKKEDIIKLVLSREQEIIPMVRPGLDKIESQYIRGNINDKEREDNRIHLLRDTYNDIVKQLDSREPVVINSLRLLLTNGTITKEEFNNLERYIRDTPI